MKKQDNNKKSFDKKTLVKLAPAAAVIAAVAVTGAQIRGAQRDTVIENESAAGSEDLKGLLKTVYSYISGEEEEDNSTETQKNTSKKSKKASKKKKSSIKKGSSKTLPTKSAASSGIGQGTTSTPTTEVPADGYKDGTYQGSGTGFGGTITVQVTVSDGKIASIDILSAAGETGSYLSSARGVISRILSGQSPNVDAVSGATYSSNGIIKAVQNALSQAGKEHSDITPTPTATPEPTKAPLPAEDVSYKDGTYTGKADGFDETVTVKVTIKNGKIKKLTNKNTDTAEFFDRAWNTISDQIISRQTVEGIDTVSGATYSSNGILNAVSQALSKAGKDEEPKPTTAPQPTEAPEPTEAPSPTVSPEDPTLPKLFKDGTYSASAQGYSGTVTITMVIEDGRIKEITNTNSDTRSFFNKAWRKLEPAILEKQSTEGIDTVSGATFSSMGILDASRMVIEQAKITEEPTPTVTPEPTITPEPTEAPEPTAVPEPTETPEPTATPEPTSTPEPTEVPEPTSTPEPTATPASGYIDGTYTGIGEGNDGPDSVQVTITVSGGQIVSASYNTYDDEDYFNTAWPPILGQVMSNQSAEGADTVAGATYSSLGIIQAFKNAINQAKGA